MEAYIAKLYDMYDAMSVPKTFLEAGCSEEVFLDQLDDIALQAFDDQCTPANPRFPLISELKDILKEAFYGKDSIPTECHEIDMPLQ